MTTKTDELRALFARLSRQTTFTEHQRPDTHALSTDDDLDAALRCVVREMRDEYGFRTSLDESDLETMVRGFYAGQSDAELAASLDTSAGVVERARIHLQLLREGDLEGPVDHRKLARLLDEGASTDECVVALGVSERAIRRAKQVLVARRAAQQSGYRFHLEFESLLREAGLSDEMVATRQADRAVFADVLD
ncbi:hypothetical protein [Haloprofundus halobius]|uniref:hypothetical protein n=1 Tax=Haloprofundus halobius TaxID=2876194 RepID=UPI001CD031CA|nr:hypothetical protein [Haloprofundus halobius]